MTSLLASLAQRSVRPLLVAAADRGTPSPGAAVGREREDESARDSPPGAIVPRRRSRFEPRGPEPVLGEMEGEIEERVDAISAPPRRREAPADIRGAPARPMHNPRPASDEAPLETGTRPILAAAPPVAARAAALLVPPVSSVPPTPAPPSAAPLAEFAALRPGEIAPARPREPLRETARRSDPSGPRPPTDRPVVPSVQVSIGRVEVRAMFAPPSVVRRPPPAPALSLDDYLKQRENG